MRPITRDTPQFSRPALPALFALFAVALAAAGAMPAQAAQRTFVSTTGSDASATCSLAEPCRGFAAAIARTDAGGEVIVLDSGGYGIFAVNKNVTIQSPAGVYAGISVFPGQTGITVAAPATRVVLRGLTINGQGGIVGVATQSGETSIENLVISNLTTAAVYHSGSLVRISASTLRGNSVGLYVAPVSGTATALVRDSEIAQHGSFGVVTQPLAGTTARVTIERSTLARNGAAGFEAQAVSGATTQAFITQSVLSENAEAGARVSGAGGATLWLRETAVTRNLIGLAQSGNAVFNACGGNLVVGNSTLEAGAINRINCLDQAAAGPSTNVFVQGGNAFGTTAVLGTTDDHSLDLRANGIRVARYEPPSVAALRYSPNIIAGDANNGVSGGVRGATIGGGGAAYDPDLGTTAPNLVHDAYGTIGGGRANSVGLDNGNALGEPFSTVAGGANNRAEQVESTVGGGRSNVAAGANATVAGGSGNLAGASYAAVAGGNLNQASGSRSAVGGGAGNVAGGSYAAVPGGNLNAASGDYSVATGRRAKANGQGAFAFADSSNLDFVVAAANAFHVRATGGLRFVTDIDGSGNATRAVDVKPGGILDFGSNERQMIGLWGNGQYGIGIQAFTHYARSDGDFAWFNKGVHSNGTLDPGAGGTMLMALRGTAAATPTAVGHAYAATFNNTSDRAAKQDFVPVDAVDVLARVAALPIASWAYRSDPAVRHLGPVAQDFHAAFAVGGDDRTISTVDATGVALAAIQGLNARLETQLAASTDRVAELERRVGRLAAMQGELAALQSALRTALGELQATRTRLAAAD